jgi:hypothetical protein
METGSLRPPEWHKEGLCVGHPDPELWSYHHNYHKDARELQILRLIEAIEICNDCPVRALCLKQGLENENMHTGTVWGGHIYSERLILVNKSTQKSVEVERPLRKRLRARVAKVS